MLFGGLQVLAESKHIATYGNQMLHGFNYFFFCFAQAQHDPCFSTHTSFFQHLQYLEAAAVFGLYTNLACHAFYGFHIMAYHMWRSINNTLNLVGTALEI